MVVMSLNRAVLCILAKSALISGLIIHISGLDFSRLTISYIFYSRKEPFARLRGITSIV
jgi:hypothetical protein